MPACRPRAFLTPGNRAELDALLAAVERSCGCAGRQRCGPHGWLEDQAVLRRLIFYRRRHAALRRGEWLTTPRWSS